MTSERTRVALRAAWVSVGASILAIAALSGASRREDILLAPGTSVRNVQDPFDYFSNSWGVIGLKDYPEATRLSPAGEFLLGEKVVCRVLVGEVLAPLDGRVKKALEKGYLPIVRQDFVLNGAVEYGLEAFACPIPGLGGTAYDYAGEANFLNLLRVSFRNRAGGPESATLGLEWKTPGEIRARGIAEKKQWAVLAGGALIGTISGPQGMSVTLDGRRVRVRTELGPGEEKSVTFALPFHGVPDDGSSAGAALAGLDFDAWRTRTAEFWDGLLARGARISVPEDKVLQSWLASLVYQFIGRDKGALRAGEGFYDEFYLRDGAYQAISLAQAGFLDESRLSLGSFPAYQRENGQFVSQEGQLDANGYAVWALVEYALLSGDNAWLDPLYPSLHRAVDFIRSARGTESDRQSPFFGILPRAPADGENLWNGHSHIVGYDWWNLRAVQSTAEAARMLARKEDEAALRREFEDYRDAILRAVDRTGLPYIPPSYEKEGTHWGNLEVVFPTILLDPYDRRVTMTLEHVRTAFGRDEGARPGLIEGLMQWTPKTNAIHPYMSLFVTNSHIIRGEQDNAVDGLYSFLLHSTSTQGFPEGVYYQKREAWGDTLPHLWAAALYVTTLRNMIVREEGEDLHIFSAVPSAWLEPGKRIVAENLPTRFGGISIEAEAQKDAILVRFTRPARTDPMRVLIHLPPDLEITEVGRCGNRGLKMSRVRDVFIPGMNLTDLNELNICIQRKPGVPHPDFAAKVAEYFQR